MGPFTPFPYPSLAGYFRSAQISVPRVWQVVKTQPSWISVRLHSWRCVCVWGSELWVGGACNRRLERYFLPRLYCTSFFFEDPSMLSPVAFPYPAWVPPAPPFGAVLVPVLSQNRGLSFPFPVISQAPPSPQSGGRRPPSLPLCKPFLHSFYSWLEQPLPLSVPRKGMSGWSLVTGHWLLIAGWRT